MPFPIKLKLELLTAKVCPLVIYKTTPLYAKSPAKVTIKAGTFLYATQKPFIAPIINPNIKVIIIVKVEFNPVLNKIPAIPH